MLLPIAKTSRTLVIVAGGTGGHIMPGLAVARCAKQEGWQVLWLGHPQKLEGRLVPEAGIELLPLAFTAVRGRGLLPWISLPFRLVRSVWSAITYFRAKPPSLVLGFGGYTSVPGALAARLLRIPLVIHESNSIAGFANRLLALLCQRTLVGFANALARSVWVGNPIGQNIENLPTPEVRFLQRQGRLKLLVLGGSQGARILNLTVPAAVALLPEHLRPIIRHQCGAAHLALTTDSYAKAGVVATIEPFITDMAQAYGDCDLAICRSGAMTVSELIGAGVASLLVPFPFASDDHQSKNAQYLIQAHAAQMMAEKEFTPEALSHFLAHVTRATCLSQARAARALAQKNSAAEVVRQCADLLPTPHAA